MKINSINVINNNLMKNNIVAKQNSNNVQQSANLNANFAVSYPKNYYISFTGASFDELHKRYETTMPKTVKDYIDTLKYMLSDKDFEDLKQKGFIAFHTEAFADLKECKTTQDIKSKFPAEPAFKNIKSLKEVSQDEAGIFGKMSELNAKGIKILDSDEDVTTFIIKKIFLECKEYKEVFNELNRALTPEARMSGLGELFDKFTEKRKSDASIYRPLGIVTPNGRAYSAGVRYSDADYSKTKRRFFSNFSAEETNEKISKLLSKEDKRARYSMMDAWNNCVEIRESLSAFLIQNLNNPDFYSSKISQYGDLSIYDSKFYTKMHVVMTSFWNKYPEYKEKLGQEVVKALARYNQIAGQGEEELNKHIEQVEKKSDQIRKTIQLNKIKTPMQFPKAVELISIAARKPEIFGYRTESIIQDFCKLILDRISQKEFMVLEGNPKSEEFKALVPNGIKAKMREIVSTSEFTNISNAHHLALIEQVLLADVDEEEKTSILEQAQKSLKNTTNNIVFSHLSRKIDLNSVETAYNRLKAPLSEGEAKAVKEELLNGTVVAHMIRQENVDSLLQTQGKYLKYVLLDNDLKDLTKQLFWSEYDRVYGSNLTHFVNREKEVDSNLDKLIASFEEIDFEKLMLSW